MITNANALTSALAHLLTEQPGHRIWMDSKIQRSTPCITSWCAKNELSHEIAGGKLTLWRDNEKVA